MKQFNSLQRFQYSLFHTLRQSLITKKKNEIKWNFASLLSKSDQPLNYSLVVLNHTTLNKKWLKPIIQKSESILLADGGANIFLSTIMKNWKTQLQSIDSKVKAIVGDLDSLNKETQTYYKKKSTSIIKIEDQDKNDFQKTLEYGIQQGSQDFVCLSSFGQCGRLDHFLSTLSITERIIKQNHLISMIFISQQSIIIPLRSGVKHQINLPSQLFLKNKCGLISFQKIKEVETSGFKWNLGKNFKSNSIEWGRFLSTSNQAVENDVTINFKEQQGLLYFVGILKKNYQI